MADKIKKGAGPSKYESDSSSSDSESDSSDSGDEGTIAKNAILGPAMPPGWRKRSPSPAGEEDVYGPVVPSKKQKTEDNQSTIGPTLPGGFKPGSGSDEDDDDDDDDVIGPRLPGMGETTTSAAEDFERRAERMKKKLLGKDEPKAQTRETWMTELPDKLGASLLGMPVAKTRFGDGNKTKIDRAGWTETPQDREKRMKEGKSQFEAADKEDFNYIVSGRDQEMQAAVEQLNSSRQDSLLDLHRKKLSKKQKKKEKKDKKEKKKKKKNKDKDKKSKKESKKDKKDKKEKPTERRPFDRDVDLKANVFDNAKKKALIKRSQQLNSRFQSSGQTGQFL